MLRLRVHELRAAGVPVLQAAAAAGIAWAIAHDVLDHTRPFFAPIAATIVLGLAPGRRSRRAVEMVIGVALGIAVGDLLIAAIGSGAAQIALVVAARDDGGDPARRRPARRLAGGDVGRARGGAALEPRDPDALRGRARRRPVGLAVLAAVPRNPLTVVRRITRPLFTELKSVLEGIAVALADGDHAAAERLLARARATSDYSDRLRQELAQAEETTRLAPTYWRSRGEVERYAEAAPHVDLAVRNVRVLARAALSVIETGAPVPAGIPHAVRGLATPRTGSSASSRRAGAPRRRSRRHSPPPATRRSRSSGRTIPLSVIVGQIRSTAVDLLRALGIERSEAVEHVRAAARARSVAG